MNNRFAAFFLILITSLTYSQSTSVFDANIFNIGNHKPPLRIGGGFLINDPFKQTLEVFTEISSNEKNLISLDNNTKKTSIKCYYFKDESDYKRHLFSDINGKFSFFNLISFGADYFTEENESSLSDSEKLVISSNVDFGMFKFKSSPILLPEAKAIIENKNFEQFIDKYGTHYINGVEKESSIQIILSKTSSENQNSTNNLESQSLEFYIPTKADGSFGASNGNFLDQYLSANSFSIEIKINGPDFDKTILEKDISNILENNNINDKYTQISNLISKAQTNISKVETAYISQYYYAPFTLHGVENINWDVAKQNKLIEINNYLYDVLSSKFEADLYNKKLPSEVYEEEIVPIFSFNSSNESVLKNSLIPNILDFYKKNRTFLNSQSLILEKLYESCSNILCKTTDFCCANIYDNKEFMKFKKYEDDIALNFKNELVKLINYEQTLECEKQNYGTAIFNNQSIFPYTLYNNVDNTIVTTINGKSNYSINLKPGNYSFKAIQTTGFTVYATVNIRKFNLAGCQEQILEVGFEE